MSSDCSPLDLELQALNKDQLIDRLLSLQASLSDLASRVDSVRQDNGKLRAENETLRQYIDNLVMKVGGMTGLSSTLVPSVVLNLPHSFRV